MRYVFIAAALYILYKLVFDLIIPVSRATSQVRSQMRQMQEAQQQQFQQQQAHAHTTAQQRQEPSTPKPSKDDYLDFEEIK